MGCSQLHKPLFLIMAQTPSSSAKKIKLKSNPLAELTPAKQEQVQALNGIVMSEIRYVSPEKLRPNPLNSIFPEESAAYFEELSNDIQERGITDPLVAKPDGTLLTGHNRLTIAKRLGLPRVPIRYVQTGMNEEAKELEFVIKDNLLRRHLNDAQRIALYEKLYPNFHERRKKAIDYGKALSEGRGNGVTPPPPKDMLTVQEIAEATGQKPENVKQQLARFYRKNPDALQANGTQIHSLKNTSKNTNNTLHKNSHNTAKLHRTFSKYLEHLKETFSQADEPTQTLLRKEIKEFVKGL